MLEIKNKIEFENNCWVGLVDASNFNSSQEARIKAVTDISSVCFGRLGFKETPVNVFDGALSGNNWEQATFKARERLYNRLKVESAGNPSTPFEFVPIKTKAYYSSLPHWALLNNEYLCTNYRAVLNDERLAYHCNVFSEEVKDFKVIVGRVPMKVISHLRTHRAFSWLVESSRNKRYLNEVEFWYPSWWNDELKANKKDRDDDDVNDNKALIKTLRLKPEEATMELSDRRLVHFAMCAWKQDSNAWDNLFTVRGDKTGTMSITGITVNNIKKLIYEN